MRGQGAQPLLVRARILEVIVDNLLPSLCVPLGGRRTGNLVHFRMCLPVSLLQPLHARDVDVAGGVREVRRILDLWH